MANQDNRHHCYLSTILSVRTDVPGEGGRGGSWRCHLRKSTDNFRISKRLAKYFLSKISMYLAELIFHSTSVIVPTPS